ncbi:MAG TPA: C25 family cysteine peptidase [Pyrinomonadaceae bacterium]|jgi:hypothetical protein
MKKLISFFVMVMLCPLTNIQVFSQKNRSITKTPLTKQQKPTKNQMPGNVPSDVSLKSVAAYSEGEGVYVRWQTEHENKNLGFYLYRVGANGPELVSDGFIPGGRTFSSEDVVYGENYSYFDERGDASSIYYIESIQSNGNRNIIGQVSTTPVDDLISLTGTSSKELKRKREETVSRLAGESRAVLPLELQTQYETNNAAPDIVMQRWVASQPGVKIAVKQEGIYRVSRTDLQNAGFDVNASSDLWQLYADGKQQSIIVAPDGSYIEFYGQGIDTPESDTRVYYLLVGAQNGLRMATNFVRPLSGNIQGTNYFQTFTRRDRLVYLSPDILNGEEENFFSNTLILGANAPTTPGTITVNFNLTGVDFNSSNAVVEVGVQGITGTPHQFAINFNGVALNPVGGNGFVLMKGTYQVPTSALREGANTLQLQSLGGAGANGLFHSISVSYNRRYEAIQNRLSAYTNNYRQTAIGGFQSANIRIFDLTFPDNPSVLSNVGIANNSGNYRATIPASQRRPFYAVEDSAILAPSSVTSNAPSTLSTAAHNGELIIVAYRTFMQQANDWANYRRAQGLTVEVVDIEDVSDEFSYGTTNSAGMTEFFKFAEANWQTPPNYILLIGDMSYDPRNYENRAFQNFIPTKRVDTIYEETGSDEALCDFDNDGLAEISIGRIPARTSAQAILMMNKMVTFEANLATAYSRGILFASDQPEGYDFAGLSQRLGQQLPPAIPQTFITRDATNRNLMIADINQGRYMVNYSGHGAAGSWNGNWMVLGDPQFMTNAPNYTVFNMLTCANGYFLRTNFDSLAEALLKSQNGGAVAVWASTGKTTPDVQEVMAARFYNQLNVGTMNRFGDLVKDAKQNVVGGRDVRLSWALLGDPTMKLKP